MEDLAIPKYSNGEVIILKGVEFINVEFSPVIYEIAMDKIPIARRSNNETIKPKKISQKNFNLSTLRKRDIAKKDPSNNFKLPIACLIIPPL